MVFIGGPRQVGKTTFALSFLPEASEKHPAYLNWDDVTTRSGLLRGELPGNQHLIILDEIHKLALFSPLGALALCLSISMHCEVQAEIKWPNDVLLNGRKTAGILAESHWQENRLSGLVLGIGVNLLKESVPPDDQILFPATCVQAHCRETLNPRNDERVGAEDQIIYLAESPIEPEPRS